MDKEARRTLTGFLNDFGSLLFDSQKSMDPLCLLSCLCFHFQGVSTTARGLAYHDSEITKRCSESRCNGP